MEQGGPTPPARLNIKTPFLSKMKFLIEGSKRKRRFLLAGLLLLQTGADVALFIVSSDPPAKYHIEASFKKADGFKVVFDKR
jgi:hypothetical protein